MTSVYISGKVSLHSVMFTDVSIVHELQLTTITGTILFGIVLYWLVLETQSIWPAVLLHMKRFCHHFQSPKKIIT